MNLILPRYDLNYDDFIKYLVNEGIDPDRVNFYEQLPLGSKPSAYARVVSEKKYSDAYKEKARAEVESICKIVYQHLLSTPDNKGLCTQVSDILSSFLDKAGYWNYKVTGSLIIDFPKENGLPRKSLLGYPAIREGIIPLNWREHLWEG